MLGTQSIGIQAPIYRGEGNILDFICKAIQNSEVELNANKINMSLLEDTDFTPSDMAALEPFMELNEE